MDDSSTWTELSTDLSNYDVEDESAYGEKGNWTTVDWTWCAAEQYDNLIAKHKQAYAPCHCDGQSKVRYGSPGHAWSKEQETDEDGMINCTNSIFGDPVKHHLKQCECSAPNTIAQVGGHGSQWSRPSCVMSHYHKGTMLLFKDGVTQKSQPTGTPNAKTESYAFEVDVMTLVKNGEVGVVFHYKDEDNYYRLVLSTKCASLHERSLGRSQKIHDRRWWSLDVGEWKTVRVQVVGRDIRIQLGDWSIISAVIKPDLAVLGGRIGLYTYNTNRGYFRNFRYSEKVCSHFDQLLIPDGLDYAVIAVEAEADPSKKRGGILAHTSDGMVTGKHWWCTNHNFPSTDLSWAHEDYDPEGHQKDHGWAKAVPHYGKKIVGINAGAKWIWTKNSKDKKVRCRAQRFAFNISHGGFTYEHVNAPMTWHEAELHCQSLGEGAHLASVHSEEENELLANLVGHSGDKDFWIGMNDIVKESEYVWSDGSKVDYPMPWSKGEPNDFKHSEDCVQFRQFEAKWNDMKCSSKMPFVCRWPTAARHAEDDDDDDDEGGDEGGEGH